MLAKAGATFFAVNRDKSPKGKWKETTCSDPRELGSAAYGVRLPDGMIVLDFDGPAMQRKYRDIKTLHATLCVDTPSGGKHVYYRNYAGPLQQTQVQGEGLDIRLGGAGYVVGPGSTSIDGKTYKDGCYTAANIARIEEMPRSIERWAETTLEAQGQKPKRKAKAKAAAPAKPSAAPRKASRGRPALDAWRKALPDLTDTGQQLQGACPSCGGEDRFSVRYAGDWSEAAPGVFCRKCAPDGSAAPDALDAIFKAAFAKPSPFAKAPDNVVPIEAYEDRRAGAAKRRQKDDPLAYRGVADVPMRAVRWAWKGWLAKGVLHVLAAAPAAGKGTVLAKMAACLVKGEWPDGSKSEPGAVMLHGNEDSLSQIVLPRLAAAGLTREEIDSSVYVISRDGMKRPEVLLKQIQEQGAMANLRGIILDDLAEGLAVTEDGNSARPVQRFLRRVTYLGEQLDIPVIGGRHTKKFSQDFGGDVTQLIMGSNQFYAVPRVALLLIKNERPEGEKEGEEKTEDQMVQDANRATLVRCKANLPVGWDTGGWAISGANGAIVGKDEAHGGIPMQASVASVWEPLHGGYLTLARYALGVRGDDSRRKADGRSQERERTKACIREQLTGDGMHAVAAVVQAATEATGQTERAIYGTLKAMEATGEIVRRSVNAATVEAEALPAGTRKVVQLAKVGEPK